MGCGFHSGVPVPGLNVGATGYEKMEDGCCHKTVMVRCTDCGYSDAPKFKAEVDHNTVVYEPWHPMTDPVDIKHLGKALEELGELVSALARCLVQGIDENEPQTKKPNRRWLQEEVADVQAGIELLEERFNLVRDTDRTDVKKRRLGEWHAMA